MTQRSNAAMDCSTNCAVFHTSPKRQRGNASPSLNFLAGASGWGGLTAALGMLLVGAAPVRAAVDPAVLEAEKARVAVVEKASSAAVAVFSPGGQGGGS